MMRQPRQPQVLLRQTLQATLLRKELPSRAKVNSSITINSLRQTQATIQEIAHLHFLVRFLRSQTHVLPRVK